MLVIVIATTCLPTDSAEAGRLVEPAERDFGLPVSPRLKGARLDAVRSGWEKAPLIRCCEAGNDHDGAPPQFDFPRIGYRGNVGFYSRKRAVKAESSFPMLA